MRGKIMIVDDDKAMCDMLAATLAKQEFSPVIFTSAEEAFKTIMKEDFDVLLTDLNMKGLNGIQLCDRVVANRPNLPVIIITAFGSMETAISAIRAGAYDFINKPFDTDILVLMLDRAVEHSRLKERIRILTETEDKDSQFENIIGNSGVMKKMFERISRAAESDAAILITGESGTGKELVAKALHHKSKRGDKPFITVNCSAIPETLLESELFGYKKGAFTDAKTDKKGLFLLADTGTLFLDEIGEMPVLLQAKLLRALEENTVRPLGGNTEEHFDVRIVSATNRNVDLAVEQGKFREDLYYRLNVVNIEVPPLRSRRNDIILIAEHFLHLFTSRREINIEKISKSAIERLLLYDWPGNVRELKNCIERAVALTNHNQIIVEDLPDKIRNYSESNISFVENESGELMTMSEVERRYIIYVLKKTKFNKSLAARILDFDRKTLYNKLEYYKIDVH
ncbi:MAG: sigma-54-dependent Fis family transcriptional regulator [Spirochaetales bacterium]|nr:sigma-54-dependent Fis family transcriptional regulator [Spirochaetales bacterium]